jgi:hypothetical protein
MGARIAVAIVALAALQGCGAGAYVVYDGSRQASKEVIGQVLAEGTPGIDQDAGSACIVKALTWREVIALGTSDSSGPSAVYRSKVAEVQTREGVPECLAAVPVTG